MLGKKDGRDTRFMSMSMLCSQLKREKKKKQLKMPSGFVIPSFEFDEHLNSIGVHRSNYIEDDIKKNVNQEPV